MIHVGAAGGHDPAGVAAPGRGVEAHGERSRGPDVGGHGAFAANRGVAGHSNLVVGGVGAAGACDALGHGGRVCRTHRVGSEGVSG